MADSRVDRFPFTGFENDFAVNVWVFTAKSTQIHDLPRDDRVHRQTIQESIQRFELPVLNSAAGLQRSKIILNFPTNGVVKNDLRHLSRIVDRQCRYEQPLNGCCAVRRIRLFGEHYIQRDFGKLVVLPIGRMHGYRRGSDFSLGNACVACFVTLACLGLGFCGASTDVHATLKWTRSGTSCVQPIQVGAVGDTLLTSTDQEVHFFP